MAYALCGIPMAMVMFQSMGERMNKFYSIVIKRIRKWLGRPRTEATEFDLIVASGIASSITVWCGAILYHLQEGWSFFDSFYYTFITLSTIGFGDFVALQGEYASLQFRPGYVVCSFIFLIIGLSTLSSSINLLVLRFMILSLEEEDGDDGDGVDGRGVLSLDADLMAVNGRTLLGGGQQGMTSATSERNLVAASAAEADRPSICSCTCYGRGSGDQRGRSNGSGGAGDGPRRRSRVLWCVGKVRRPLFF